MFLELHDAKPPTLVAWIPNLDYHYMAEQWVIDTHAETSGIVRWVLFTDEGLALREWHRKGTDFQEVPVTPGTVADPRSLAQVEAHRVMDQAAAEAAKKAVS